MPDDATAKADRSAPVSGVEWDVVEVKPLPGFQLQVRFHDGVEGRVDLNRFVHAADAGVFSVLADPVVFSRVGIELGVVIWPDVLQEWPYVLDLAPDAMHDEIQKSGEWVL